MYQFKEMPKDIVFIDDDDDDSIDEGKKETPSAVNRSNQKGKGERVTPSTAVPKIINFTSGQDAFMTLQQSTANTATAPGYEVLFYFFLSLSPAYKNVSFISEVFNFCNDPVNYLIA